VPDGRPEHLVAACEGSLRRLRLDQIALYQLHRPDPNVPLAESIGALVQLQQDGKIRHIGVSNVSERQLRDAREVARIVSVQNRYNASDQSSDPMIDLCEREGLAFLPWAPILDLDRNRAVQELAAQHDATPRQIALAWLLARSPVMLAIPGTGSVAHLESNVAAAGLSLSAQELATIRPRRNRLRGRRS
jgi:aryl-alcohol dehydrogenase-like predicted oxidoreductase